MLRIRAGRVDTLAAERSMAGFGETPSSARMYVGTMVELIKVAVDAVMNMYLLAYGLVHVHRLIRGKTQTEHDDVVRRLKAEHSAVVERLEARLERGRKREELLANRLQDMVDGLGMNVEYDDGGEDPEVYGQMVVGSEAGGAENSDDEDLFSDYDDESYVDVDLEELDGLREEDMPGHISNVVIEWVGDDGSRELARWGNRLWEMLPYDGDGGDTELVECT